jgi:hypothetical protein
MWIPTSRSTITFRDNDFSSWSLFIDEDVNLLLNNIDCYIRDGLLE